MSAAASDPSRPIPRYRWEIGVDTGGTFTDCVARGAEGEVITNKVLSSSALRARVRSISGDAVAIDLGRDLSEAMDVDRFFRGFAVAIADAAHRAVEERLRVTGASRLDSRTIQLSVEGWTVPETDRRHLITLDLISPWEAPIFAVRWALARGGDESLSDCRICVGTTRGTNAILEGKTTPTALFVNEGLEDILAIGDQRRLDIFARAPSKAAAIERASFGIPGRIAATGEEIQPLDEEAITSAARSARREGIRVAAIALLHADGSRPEGVRHETQVATILRREGFMWTSCSHEAGAATRFEPRARAAVIDAALSGAVGEFAEAIKRDSAGANVFMMTSAGGLVPIDGFRPRESLLSGPAGGSAGAALVAMEHEAIPYITFDMGGTSSDVSRSDGPLPIREETVVGNFAIASPSAFVESVACGGGSVLWCDGESLRVGPHSAGANPGPACYGAGGPLTLTDAHLLLARVDPENFPLPCAVDAARVRAEELAAEVARSPCGALSLAEMLQRFVAIAEERIAAAIRTVTLRRGVDPSDHTLIAFGGCGGVHACSVADLLGVRRVVLPSASGVLCADGISLAPVSRVVATTCLGALDGSLSAHLDRATNRAHEELARVAGVDAPHRVCERVVLLRVAGHEDALEVPIPDRTTTGSELAARLQADFSQLYERVHGYPPPHGAPTEVEKIRVRVDVARTPAAPKAARGPARSHGAGPRRFGCTTASAWIPEGWEIVEEDGGTLVATRHDSAVAVGTMARELIAARLSGIASDMGEQLRRTAVSVNIKDRLDFSCGLLDAQGCLMVNAPHIPIHLGALGPCVRSLIAECSFSRGDVLAVNHPRHGGSHLPDITVVTPIFAASGALLGFAANRAHHAEIGGTRPGSMPPDATTLAEEGVVLEPMWIVRAGEERFHDLEKHLVGARWPSRLPRDNVMDVRAQVAANALASAQIRQLVAQCGADQLMDTVRWLRDIANRAAQEAIGALGACDGSFEEQLDDGSVLRLRIGRSGTPPRLQVDFTGSAAQHPRNLNAPIAVTRAAVMYTVRVLVGEWLGRDGPAFPLNEGLLDSVDLVIPAGSILNPDFSCPAERAPACAIGQTETSQRLVDLLWRAFGLAACSQGTINNLLFGSARFGFYETMAGGAGATPHADGASAVHTHISNTRITDAEVLERRYPVRLETFRIRRGSGGAGQFNGGDGLIRRLRFLEAVDLSFLSQHRVESPYGLAGGEPGARGRQRILRRDGSIREVPGIVAARLEAGDAFEIETPGGGGYGAPTINRT